MNIEQYHKFLSFQDSGLKKKATESLRGFISSFESRGDIDRWVWETLADFGANPSSRIRHEIFQELVYPVLKAGYIEGDFASTLWLAKLIQNIYQAPQTHAELDWVSEMELLRKCRALNPENDEARLLLLECIVKWLQYSEHEWPSGILYGNDGATLDQCGEITQEIELVLSLDKECQYNEFIKQYTKKLVQYRAWLNKSKLSEL